MNTLLTNEQIKGRILFMMLDQKPHMPLSVFDVHCLVEYEQYLEQEIAKLKAIKRERDDKGPALRS